MKKIYLALLIASCFLGIKKVNAQNTEVIYTIVEHMPQFPGGEDAMKKYFVDNIIYPSDARKNGIEGIVYVTFVVDKEGNVVDAKILKGKEDSLDAEALRVVNSMPKWKPGTQDGQVVLVQYNLPLRFSLALPDKNDKTK